MTLRRNVLIFHQAALGDFIVTWPLAVALGRSYPQSRILYVTAGQKGKLAEEALRVEAADVEAGWHPLFAEDAAPPEPVARWLAGAHTVVSFVSDGQDAWARNVRRLAPEAQLILLTTRPPAGEPAGPLAPPAALAGHVTAGLLEQLKPFVPVAAATQQILASVCDRGIGYRPKPGDAVVIHPGGGKPEKCWPVEKYVELIARLKGQQPARPVRVLLGEVELEKWPADCLARLRDAADEVRQPTSLLDLLRELSGSAFVGNDSGPGHLAGIIGLPTVSVFGPADPRPWRPLGPRVQILQGPSLDAVSVEAVYQAVTSARAE